MVKIPRKIIAVIPARGGSKRIKNKNLVMLAGKPLLAHSIEHAKNSKYVAKVIVSTDDQRIAAVAKKYGAAVVMRPKNLATDKASSEEALLHVLDNLHKISPSPGVGRVRERSPDAVVFLQCTSPVRKKDDIDKAIRHFIKTRADSLFSACRNYGLVWERRKGKFYSLNYDFRHRKREQKMAPQYRENGSIYVLKPEILKKYHNRLGGKIAVYEMDFWKSFQVDEPQDLKFVEWIIKNWVR